MNRTWIAIAVLVLLAYLLNCVAPLRLTNDTVRYFTIKEQLEGTWPAQFAVNPDFLPYGYVWFLSALTSMGILSSPVIIILHTCYLLASLFFVKRIFGDAVKWGHLFLFTLLNWTSVKYTLIPLSEMQFLFLTTGAIYFFQAFEQKRKIFFVFLVALFCVGACYTRTAGFVLPLALAASFVFVRRKPWLAAVRAQKWMALPALILFLGLMYGVYAIRDNAYFSYFSGPFSESPIKYITTNFWKQLIYWGELFVNMPWSKTVAWVPAATGAMIFRLAGLVFLVVILYRVFSKRVAIPAPVRIYILFYLLLIFSWPFFDARFFFPVLPLLIAVLLTGPEPSSRPSRIGINLFNAVYLIVGVVALGYYVRLSFNNAEFAQKHDAGKWRREYELHFSRQPGSDSAINTRALYILNKYD